VTPQRLRTLVRGELDWVTMKALARDRQMRYPTVRELGRDIERYLQHRPVEAGPPSAWYVLRKWVQRHAGAVAAVGVVGCLAAGWATMSVVDAAEKSRLTRAAARARQPLVAAGLLEARTRFGLATHRAEVERWLSQARDLLAAEDALRTWKPGQPNDEVESGMRFALPALREAEQEVLQLVSDLQWLAEQDALAADAWRDCSAAICADAGYSIGVLPQQRGLVPLGKDPDSGLFEFELLDPRCREEPHRRVHRQADGRLTLSMFSNVIMVLLPGGPFRMGTADFEDPWIEPDSAAPEVPAHEVVVEPFFLAKHELTAAQHCVYEGDHPGYWDLKRFIARLRERKKNGETIDVERAKLAEQRNDADRRARQFGTRLPTEAEWEYAARAGTTTAWSFASTEAALRRHANVLDPTPESPRVVVHRRADKWLVDSDGFDTPSPVGMFAPNAFGLHDMHGNVSEWCADALTDYDPKGEATSAVSDRYRVVRGGSFQSDVQATRSARRREAARAASQRDFGVRLARSVVGTEFR
jgi:formylglycine-generating enzyme required for sulfatase activity